MDSTERVEGWVHVWEMTCAVEKRLFSKGHHPKARWEPRFCVLMTDIRTFQFYTAEQNESMEDDHSSSTDEASVTHTRLDGGRASFQRRWGYTALEIIQEHSEKSLFASNSEDSASAESFFRSRTHVEYRDDSNIPDSSLERMDEQRRGSLPLVSTYNESMESVSTTSRLANFFSKKGFKSNLKRTKSATKLDRKRSSPNLSEHDTSSLMGSLKRSMSLGRLSKKKSKSDSSKTRPFASSTPSRQGTPHDSPALSLISARIRSSRSHESLLASPPSMHSIDLSAPDVEVKPLHSSVLGQGHCFHVSTSQGSKYISCTTSEERDKWISSLRRTIRPHEEHSRRSDSSLKLWILEAKNVATKKRYFCDILLDRTLYAQTSMKMMTDMLFWGEHFEFKNLPVVEIITVNLYREADKKKKKDKNQLVGYVNMLLADFENRQLVEKWITCNSGTVGKAGKETKSDLPIIRLKARRQTVDILPLETYQSFIKYLSSDYKQLCQMLEPLLTVREKDDFATCLVHVLQKQGKACEFLSDIVIEEISQLDNEHLTFRGNSIATKAMEAYMKLVGEKYLQDTLGEFIRQLIQSPDDCEVDPTKVATPQLLNCQQKNLDMYSNMAWVKVINSFCYFPNELREVFASFRSRCNDKGKGDYSDNLISGCIFLRFLCPAILYPSLFNITQEYPNERASRNLTLIAKTIQTLANFTQFGGKEEFMTFMNTFVEREASSMKSFLHKISSPDAGNQFLEFDGYIDLGKELSVLHALLLECTEKYSETAGKPFDNLNTILNTLSSAFDDPTVGQKKPNRKSQIYDNLIPVSLQPREAPQIPNKVPYGPTIARNLAASSPTEVLIDMLRHCGESTDDIPALANRGKSTDSSHGDISESSSSQTTSGVSSTNRVKGTQKMKKVSVVGPHTVYSERTGNEAWVRGDKVNVDYTDLIPFMDDDAHNSSMEMDDNKTGSQVSIEVSTVTSSGFQSLTHTESRSDSPADTSTHPQHVQEMTREITRSPVIHFCAPPQPLAFSNPLFQHHQQQQSRHSSVRTGSARTLTGITLSQAETVQRASSNSSLSSDGSEVKDSASGPRKSHFTKMTSSSLSVSSDYQSSIAPLKKLSQLSSSSSNDSLNEQSVSSVSSSSHSSHSSNVVHSTSASFMSMSSSTRTTASVMPFLGNSAMNGCSTFPRRHRGQQGQTNRDASPPQTQRETMSTSSVVIDNSTPMTHHCPGVQRQMSTPGHRNASSGVLNTQQPSRPFPKRAGLTTNQAGHLQHRNFHGVKTTAGLSPSDVDNLAQRSNPGSQHSLSSSPVITSRGYSTSAGSSATSSTYSSPATQHRLDKSSLLGSPANLKINGITNPTTSITAASSVSCKGVTHKPPTATTTSTGWQIAHHMERSSSSQETSSSSESSPQSLVRSNQHSTSSMHESSSAHSISSAYSPLQPWGYTPSHSDSNSSVNSLTKIHQRVPARSDSSGSLGGANNSRISQTPSDSNSSVSSGNNNVAGLSNSSQLDNRGLFHNHPSPASFNARLSSISDSQINTLSLQTNPLPQAPAFLTTKYAVVHPHPNPAASPRAERVTSYHSNPECTNSSSNISGSYTASRSMDLGYLSKPRDDTIKRASTDSFLNQPTDGLSPTGSEPSWPLICDDSWQPGSPTINSASNRRLSQQSTVHMGISSVQRKLQEQERAKQEFEQEVHVLRQQLLEAQERLHQAELRLLDHEMETHKLMDEWQYRLVESEEKMRRQQAEKDEQMKAVLSRLQSIEEELKKEQAEMASAVEHRQQVIEVQEQRIRKLDQANNKLLQDLADLKGRALRAAAADENSNSSLCNGILGSNEIAGFKTSSC